VPDLHYLVAKGVDAKDPQKLFDRLTFQLNKVDDTNLKQDLTPLFLNRTYIEHWLQNWRESYFRLLDDYRIHTVAALQSAHVQQEFHTDIYYFGFIYETTDGGSIRFVFALSDYWITFGDADLRIRIDPKIAGLITFGRDFASSRRIPEELLKEYASVFFYKIERHLDRVDRIVLGDEVRTKLIRMTADKLNQREQILLNKSALLSCELEDLLK
jgi:hypothetical protein